jgi:hypothetical protein
MRSQIFILLLALSAVLGSTWQTISLANPISLIESNGHGMVGFVHFDNADDYPDYALGWRDVREKRYLTFLPNTYYLFARGNYSTGGVLTPFAVHIPPFDSASNDRETARQQFLWSKPPIIPSEFRTAPLAVRNIGQYCEGFDDIVHIVKLDSAEFLVKPVKVVYHTHSGRAVELLYRNSRRPQLYPGFAENGGLHLSLSIASLLIFAFAIQRNKRP